MHNSGGVEMQVWQARDKLHCKNMTFFLTHRGYHSCNLRVTNNTHAVFDP